MTQLDRRRFLQLIAAAPVVALAPWRQAVPQLKTVSLIEAYYLAVGPSLYRYVRFHSDVQPGDLVWWKDGAICGVSRAWGKPGWCGWVQVRGPVSVRRAHHEGTYNELDRRVW